MISSLLPYDKSLVDATDVVVGKEKVPCKLCNKEVDMEQMQLHVGKHILENNLSNVCGFSVAHKDVVLDLRNHLVEVLQQL